MQDQDTWELAHAVVPLVKGVVYRDQHEQAWQRVLRHRPAIADYVRIMGLGLVVDENEGYAFLRSLSDADFPEGVDPPPRLVVRHSLSFPVSLLLALLRRRLAESDTDGSQPRLILTRGQIVDMIRHFLPATSDDTRLIGKVDQYVAKAEELGFLRKVKGQSETWEVRRVLKAFVDAQTLSDFEARLDEYLRMAKEGGQG